jgi:Outer membrane protein beta-barrel domain
VKIARAFGMTMIVLTAAPATVLAQASAGSGPYVVGAAGAGQLWDDESSIGVATNLGGGVGYRVARPLDVEFLVDRRDHDRRFTSGVRFEAGMIRAIGRALVYFSSAGVQPYVGGAVGAARVHRATEFPGLPRRDDTSTATSTSAIAGVRIFADPRLFVRPEFEIGRAGEYLMMGGSVSVGWRF